MDKLRELIVKSRNNNNISIQQAVMRLGHGLTCAQLLKWENGSQKIPNSMFIPFSEAYNINIYEFYNALYLSETNISERFVEKKLSTYEYNILNKRCHRFINDLDMLDLKISKYFTFTFLNLYKIAHILKDEFKVIEKNISINNLVKNIFYNLIVRNNYPVLKDELLKISDIDWQLSPSELLLIFKKATLEQDTELAIFVNTILSICEIDCDKLGVNKFKEEEYFKDMTKLFSVIKRCNDLEYDDINNIFIRMIKIIDESIMEEKTETRTINKLLESSSHIFGNAKQEYIDEFTLLNLENVFYKESINNLFNINFEYKLYNYKSLVDTANKKHKDIWNISLTQDITNEEQIATAVKKLAELDAFKYYGLDEAKITNIVSEKNIHILLYRLLDEYIPLEKSWS